MAESADVTFVFDGDDSGLAAASKRVVKELRDTQAAFDNMRKAAKSGDAEVRRLGGGLDDLDLGRPETGVRKFTLSADNLGKTLSFLSPRLGEVSAKAYSLGAAGGPLLLAASGLLAVAAAGVAVGAMALETARNIDDLSASLTRADREAVAGSIDALVEQRARLDDAADGWTQLKIVVSAAVGGPLTDYLYLAGNVAEQTAEVSEATDTWLLDLVMLPARMATPLFVVQKYADALGLVADTLRDVEKEQARAGSSTPRINMEAEANAPTAADLTFDFARQPNVTASRNRGRVAAANDDGFALFSAQWDAAVAAQQAAYDEGFALFSAQWDAQVAYAQASQDAIVEVGRRSVLQQAAQQEYLREVEAARMAQREERERQMADASIALTFGVADAAVSALSQSLAAQAKSARESWEIQQATALAMALINVPAAILTGLSQGGPVLAAVNGVLAGIQFAAIAAARPPQYHVGGYAPDEVPAGGMTLRDTERTAVVTPAGQQYLTPAMLAAINSGAMNRAEAPPIYLLVDGVAQRARRLATNPGTGYSTSGGRRG